jgi:nitrogen-specific signal transduction histidine kinase
VSADELDFELRAIVHEVNNPLSIITTYLHLLAAKVSDNEHTYQQIQIIQEEIQRVSAIVAGLREITNPGQPSTEPTDINKLIERITNFYQKSVFQSKGLESYLDLDQDIPCIVTQPDRVKQILINLMKNAAEALQEKDKVYITTRDNVFIQGKTYIELEIEDNGPGIEQEILTHLFQPVGRLKNKQSGLGLTIVKNLVSDLDGDLSIRSGNWGTRFQIRLPRIVSDDDGGEVL